MIRRPSRTFSLPLLPEPSAPTEREVQELLQVLGEMRVLSFEELEAELLRPSEEVPPGCVLVGDGEGVAPPDVSGGGGDE